MGIAGHTPNFTAAGTILPFSCVKADTSNPFRLLVATAENDVVLGVTDGSTRAFDSVNHALAGDLVVLQNSEFVQLRAGGTISIGDGLRPDTNGSVIVATDRVQFVACDSAVSGEIFWAQRVGSVEPAIAGPVVYGSRRASTFFSDLAAGNDSLDIVVVGDSNTGSALNGFWGYHNGLSQTLNDRGYPMYGTPYSHTMTDWAVNTNTGGWLGSAYVIQPTGTLLNGNTSGGATNYAYWTPGTAWTRYGSYPNAKDAWAYISGAEYWSWYPQVFIETTHPLFNGALTLFHRIRWGTFNTGSGYFRPAVRVFGGATLATSAVVNTNTGNASSVATTEYSFTPSGASQIEASWCAGGTVAGSRGAVGPVAIHGHSIYCKRKGWSVHSHGYMSGADSSTISSVMTGIGSSALQVHLQELRERQIAAGGSGRVLVMMHSGINGADTTTTWQTAHQNVWSTYKSAWASLGYPSSDLAWVSFVSHVPNSTDTSNSGATGNLAAIRTAAQTMATTYTDMTVIDVKKLLTYAQNITGVGNGRAYYQRYNNLPNAGADITIHLSGGTYTGSTKDTSDGYTTLANLIVSALMASA